MKTPLKPSMLIQLVLPIMLLLSSCSDKKNDLESIGVSGSVSEIETSVYEADMKFGDFVKRDDKPETVIVQKFNEKGYVAESTTYEHTWRSKKEIKSKQVRTYEKGNKLLSVVDYDSDGDLKSKVECSYDSDGHLLSVVVYDSDGDLVEKTEFTYDSKGRLREEVNKESKEIIFYTYSQSEYDKMDLTNSKYDQCVLMKKDLVVAHKSDRSCYIYKYDNNGNLIGIVECDEEDFCSVEVNEFGHVVKTHEGINMASIYDALWRYKSRSYDHDLNCIYEYDKHKNWVVLKCEEDGAYYIAERVITYSK